MRMRCSKARRLMRLAIDGEIVAEKHESYRMHLAECERCRGEHLRIEQAVGLLERMPRPVPKADFTAAVMARVRKSRSAVVDSHHVRITWHMPVITALATLCVILSWNEWVLPTIVSLTGESVATLVRASRLFGPMVTFGGALATLLRSLGEAAFTLLRSGSGYVFALYGLTLAVVLTTVFLAQTRFQRLGTSALCL